MNVTEVEVGGAGVGQQTTDWGGVDNGIQPPSPCCVAPRAVWPGL
jgi:hypothetical protein